MTRIAYTEKPLWVIPAGAIVSLVSEHNAGQKLGDEPDQISAAKLLTKDAARRIAANIAKLLELLKGFGRQRPLQNAPGYVCQGTLFRRGLPLNFLTQRPRHAKHHLFRILFVLYASKLTALSSGSTH